MDINNLVLKAKQLYKDYETEKAYQLFYKCFLRDKNNKEVNLYLFLIEIKKKHYNNALKYLNRSLTNKFEVRDKKFYLYLLNIFIELPLEYRDEVKKLVLNDFTILDDDVRYIAKDRYNKIRVLAITGKFNKAIKVMYDIFNKSEEITINDLITKELLAKVYDWQKRKLKMLNELIKEERYGEIIVFYNDLEKREHLILVDKVLKAVIEDIILIKRTKILPNKTIFDTNNLFKAILGKNYELAIQLNEEFFKSRNIKNEDSSLYLALIKINELIDEIKNGEIKEEEVYYTLTDILNYLVKNDIDMAIVAVRSFLESLKKREYEFLIIDLIKISLINEDNTFMKPIIELTNLGLDNYKFEASNYVAGFYLALEKNNLKEAYLYLDILKKAQSLGNNLEFIITLEEALNKRDNTLIKS